MSILVSVCSARDNDKSNFTDPPAKPGDFILGLKIFVTTNKDPPGDPHLIYELYIDDLGFDHAAIHSEDTLL